MKTDISILFEKAEFSKKALLTIGPLAPLSIVSSLPGSYYKSLEQPTKANLCGLFENILQWHFAPKDRKSILKNISKVYKKRFDIEEMNICKSNVGYTSVLGHLFEILPPLLKPNLICKYDDIWKQQLFRDGYSHPKGTPNLSYELIPQKKKLDKKEGKITNEAIAAFHKENKGAYPMYYTSPRKREFIVVDDSYKYKLAMSPNLFLTLKHHIEENNYGYLGNSESWVDLKLTSI